MSKKKKLKTEKKTKNNWFTFVLNFNLCLFNEDVIFEILLMKVIQ